LMSSTCSSCPKHQKTARPWQQNTMESVHIRRQTGSQRRGPLASAAISTTAMQQEEDTNNPNRFACNHTMQEQYRHHSAGRSTRQHASVNGGLTLQTVDETRLSRVCVYCLQRQHDILLFTAMLGSHNSRLLYWLYCDSYRTERLSKAVPVRSKANTGSAWQQ
jgi:hypothetical protein